MEKIRLCKHPNVLPLNCCFCVRNFMWIVTPFMKKGSLYRILNIVRDSKQNPAVQGLSENIICYVIHEVLKGLIYIHSSSYLHLDIKAANILVDSNGSICLSDFGVIPSTNSSKRHSAHGFVGTPCWMAPEVVSDSLISSSADLWSLGITALELYKGFPPLARFDTREIFARILQGEAPSFDSYYDVYKSTPSSAFQSFIEKVLVKQPEERATAEDLEDHRWFQGAEEGRAELLKLLETIPDIEEDRVFDLRLDL
ncbi:uncharacterized protein [Blastocystis hominis]|uniref:Protein kinase domain-containing protein n=1 Tax=Blastocystis hominis TaxID=12968 RepID=D8LZF0_BLAHO|nr:uncharacterized protein [Blastocystis hominis]CBK21189.2 unnamed protein product [Blastocystis hominis]|eukprot:XP_012895237.1 uncharacterized protein [Blastocystis hominis]